MFNASPQEQEQAATAINGHYASGKWRPVIGKRFSLSKAGAAHQLQEENTLEGKGTLTGKIVVTP